MQPSMSTESFFMSDWSGHGHRFRDTLKRYEEERDNVTVTEPEDVRIPAWKRALAVCIPMSLVWKCLIDYNILCTGHEATREP